MDNIKIKKILLAESYVSQEDMQKAETFAKKNKTSVVEYFLSKEILTESLLGQAVAESYGVAFADLEKHAPSVEQVLKIPEHLARRYKAVLVAEREKEVLIATVNPTREGLVKDLQEVFKKKIIIAYASPEAIKKAFIHYQKPLETQFASIVKKSEKIAPEILSAIFEDAILHTASDIHFEPQGDRVLIRFRVDGVLHEAGHIENDHYENVLNRIKVQALLRIDEHFAAQDGALRYTMSNNEAVVDMRVSILPTINGEKIVIRILSQYVRSLSLSEIGLTPENEALFRKSAKSPFGMILITGPTGSGKTTSLYALLKILHRPEVNITTIEDPVEYKIKGINQIQVNLQTDLTFEKGLKSIVRQDPDIILVGEVRGEETAEIAVNAALTGHLLFSTFHANDAATALPRLLDMGIEPFLLASTLEIIVAQRLVRTICPSCRHSYSSTQKELKEIFPEAKNFFKEKEETLYKGKGCPSCRHTGYRGRKAIFEFVRITPEMQDLILTNPSTQQIWELARKQGSKSLFEDGVYKIKKGITTLEEVLRVASPKV